MSRTLLETWRGVAYPAELDHMGHMNVQYYTAKFDQGSWHLFTHIGISNSYLRDNNRGMAAVEQHTRYLAEVMAGDVLVVKSALLEVKEKLIRFRHHMYNAETGVEAANTEITALHLDRVTRRSCPFPTGIVDNCRAFIEAASRDPLA